VRKTFSPKTRSQQAVELLLKARIESSGYSQQAVERSGYLKQDVGGSGYFKQNVESSGYIQQAVIFSTGLLGIADFAHTLSTNSKFRNNFLHFCPLVHFCRAKRSILLNFFVCFCIYSSSFFFNLFDFERLLFFF